MASNPSSVNDLATPSLVLDAAKVWRNIERLAKYAAAHRIKIRPHTKTHKQRFLAQMQIDAGASGITTAKVSEAEVISDPAQDVLVAYPPVGSARSRRLAELARDRKVTVALDSMSAVEEIAAAAQSAGTSVGVLVDLDVGMGRTGVESPAATLPLAQAIDQLPNLRLAGIMIYPGHVWEPPSEQQTALRAVGELIGQTIGLWREHGLEAQVVSGGSTPTAYQSHLVDGQTEIRPGTYIFNDMNTVWGGYCALDECAARIVATVVSTAVPGQFVIDAGSKTLTKDSCIPAPERGFGYIVEYPDAYITKLSEEHGQVDVSRSSSKPKVGDRVTVIPNHICPCVNLQDSVWWSEPGELLRPLPVDARGKLQ